ncbi:MAG: hypothetical protein EA425_07905 [Puniceicoccaceae bacterium]|nr:MAG: hypothetical protein EA425_07905 [Puniceicoccaceae bacterium]
MRKACRPDRFNVHGTFYALRNICPRQFAPLCEGVITGTTEHLETGPWPGRWIRDRRTHPLPLAWLGV